MLYLTSGEERCEHIADGGWYSHAVLASSLEQLVPPMAHMLDASAVAQDWEFIEGHPQVVLCGAVACIQ